MLLAKQFIYIYRSAKCIPKVRVVIDELYKIHSYEYHYAKQHQKNAKRCMLYVPDTNHSTQENINITSDNFISDYINTM